MKKGYSIGCWRENFSFRNVEIFAFGDVVKQCTKCQIIHITIVCFIVNQSTNAKNLKQLPVTTNCNFVCRHKKIKIQAIYYSNAPY